MGIKCGYFTFWWRNPWSTWTWILLRRTEILVDLFWDKSDHVFDMFPCGGWHDLMEVMSTNSSPPDCMSSSLTDEHQWIIDALPNDPCMSTYCCRSEACCTKVCVHALTALYAPHTCFFIVNILLTITGSWQRYIIICANIFVRIQYKN